MFYIVSKEDVPIFQRSVEGLIEEKSVFHPRSQHNIQFEKQLAAKPY